MSNRIDGEIYVMHHNLQKFCKGTQVRGFLRTKPTDPSLSYSAPILMPPAPQPTLPSLSLPFSESVPPLFLWINPLPLVKPPHIALGWFSHTVHQLCSTGRCCSALLGAVRRTLLQAVLHHWFIVECLCGGNSVPLLCRLQWDEFIAQNLFKS